MANSDPTQPYIDPRLQELLGKLRHTPPREEQSAQQGRERFLAELDSYAGREQRSTTGWLAGWFKPRRSFQEETAMTNRTRLVFLAVMALIVFVVFLFGGAGATAFAARSALPGDALYPVKTSLENTRVVLAGNAYSQAQLNMRFAELRLEELNALIDEGRYGDIDLAARQFEFHIQSALQSMQTVMDGDPALGAQLSTQINLTLLRYAQALKATWTAVPPQARPPVERMILTSEHGSESDDDEQEMEITGVVEAIGATAWTVSGQVINLSGDTEIKDSIQVGDTVKVHVTQAANGAMTAREIELEGDDVIDDDNENGNDDEDDVNDNEDDNGNDDNDNGSDDDDNGNDDNGNDDDDDVNDNEDDNGNDEDDNGNDDDDEDVNDNGDDDNGNDDDNNGNDDDDNGNDDDDNGNDDDSGNDDDDNGNDDGGDDDGGGDEDDGGYDD